MGDSFQIVQQVQGLVESYTRAREELAARDNKIFQLNQDIARLEKNVRELLAENEKLKK